MNCRACADEMLECDLGVCIVCYFEFWKTLTLDERARAYGDAQDHARDDSWHRERLAAWCAEEEARRVAVGEEPTWQG